MTLKQRIGKKLYNTLPFSREVLNIFRYEFSALLTRLNCLFNPVKIARIKKYVNKESISLNLGSGPFGEVGWVNLDLLYFDNISFVYDFRRKLPFKSSSVERIRCEHVFEHLDFSYEVPTFLSECYRVLKKDSVLRIIVPDIDKFVFAYNANDTREWEKIGLQLEAKDGIHRLNHVFRQGGEHKYGYNATLLKEVGLKSGFSKVIIQSFGISSDPNLTQDLPNHRLYSLYADLIK